MELARIGRPERGLDVGNDDAAPSLLLPHETPYVTETDTGLDFRADTPVGIWGPLTARLIRAHQKIEFALADAINFGRRYGEDYGQWVHETGRSKQGLVDIAWVGRAIEPSRRRDTVSFGHHREVASLPAPMQDTLLDMVEADPQKWPQKRLRAAAMEAQQAIKKAERSLLPAPPVVIPEMDVDLGDATALDLADDLVDLIVTSPPYGLEIGYQQGDVPADDWWDFMARFCREAYRVAADHGRLALNIPLETGPANGSRPTYAQALFAAQRAGWVYRSTIVWHDDQLGKSVARGSVDSASSPYVYAPVEMVLLLSKGDWGRPPPVMPDPSDVDHLDWLAWTNGLWTVPGESRSYEGYPAAFPLSLPTRLIRLLSFPGDLVLDPFLGSGTSAVAALDAGRRFVGRDVSPEAIAITRRRLAAWKGGLRG